MLSKLLLLHEHHSIHFFASPFAAEPFFLVVQGRPGADAGAEARTDVGAEVCVVADAESDVDVEAGAEVDAEAAGTETGTEGAEARFELVERSSSDG